jgi:hypothetical protein
MKERKSIYILRLLEANEISRLRKFLQSPYFNLKEEMIAFLDVAKEFIGDGKAEVFIDNEIFWSKIFEGPYDDLKFRKLNSDFNHLVEEFLIQEEFESDKQNRNLLKIRALSRRGGEKMYESLKQDVEFGRKIDPNRNANYYLHIYNIEKSIFKLIPDEERKKDFKDINIDKISENLDIYFIAEKLKYYSDILSWNQIYNISLNMRGIEIVMKLANNPLFRDVPVIAIFMKIIMIKTHEENEEHYFDLKNLIDQHLYLFPKNEAKEIIDQALNYTINKVNKGFTKYTHESLDLYKKALNDELLIVNGKLDISDYRNITAVALKSGDITWVEHFIEDYKKNLEERSKDNAFYFSLARLETYKKNYNKVIEYLNNINYDDIWYNLNGRSLLIAAYFELNEFDALESLFQSYKTYINREKLLLKHRKKNYLDFITYTSKLMKLTKYDQDKLKKLKHELLDTPGVVNKPWLLEKIDALLNTKR